MADNKKLLSDTDLDMVAGGRRNLMAKPEENKENDTALKSIKSSLAGENNKENNIALRSRYIGWE